VAVIDLETERYVIGSMTQGDEFLDEAIATVTVDVFFNKGFKALFSLMAEMYKNGETVTPETVYVKHAHIIKEHGLSWSNITDVFARMPGFKAACGKLKETTKARQLMALSDTIRADLEGGADNADVLGKIESALMKHNDAGSTKQYLSSKEMAVKCLDVVAERMDESSRTKKCIFTGFKFLNKVTGGWEAGDLIILSGSTGGGKSAFAANIARDIAITQKLPCLYINSEMSHEQMALRWTALLGGAKHSALRAGTINQEEYVKLTERMNMLYVGELNTITMPDLRIDSVLSEIRRHKMKNNIRVAIVDYIGRMDFSDSKNKDDWQVLTGAARRLKTIAQEQNLIIIMLAQLNASGRLAQASYMSHEADLWINLRKPNETEMGEFSCRREPWNTVLEICKARNARTGTLPLYFYGERLLFTDNDPEARKYAAQDSNTKTA
jgi:replicative DNA helicase